MIKDAGKMINNINKYGWVSDLEECSYRFENKKLKKQTLELKIKLVQHKT